MANMNKVLQRLKQHEDKLKEKDAELEQSIGSDTAAGSVKGRIKSLETNKEDTNHKVTEFGETPSDTNYPSEKLVKDKLDLKADVDETGNKISLEMSDDNTYKIRAILKDKNGTAISTSAWVDLPLESMVVSGSYNSNTKEVTLTLQHGNPITFSIADLISGLQSEIDANNKLDADLVNDANSTHKFVTAEDKTTWSNKYDKPSGGIPSTDMSEETRASLRKADTALQEHQDVTGKEDKANKVSSFQVTPDDTHYPTEKLVKDSLEGKVDKVPGKQLSTENYTTAEKTKLANIETGAQVNAPVDQALNANSDNAVANSVVTNQFNSMMNLLGGKTNFVLSYAAADTSNSIFNSSATTITITANDTIKDINGNVIPVSTLLLGDIFLVTETDKPDRWVGSVTKTNDVVTSAVLYQMETTKVDLSNYATEVNFDAVNNKITYVKNGVSYDVVTTTTLKTALGLGAAADKNVTDNTTATAASSSDTNLITGRTMYNALPNINGYKTYNTNSGFYAPTTGGTSGEILKSNGSTSTPTWSSLANAGIEAANNRRTSWQSTPDDMHYPSEKLVKDSLDLKVNANDVTTETWTFTVDNNGTTTTVTKKILLDNRN